MIYEKDIMCMLCNYFWKLCFQIGFAAIEECLIKKKEFVVVKVFQNDNIVRLTFCCKDFCDLQSWIG